MADDKQTPKALQTIDAVAVTGRLATIGSPLASWFLSAIPTALKTAVAVAQGAKTARLQKFYEELIEANAPETSASVALIDLIEREPEVAEVIYDMLRGLTEAREDAIVRPLGMLVREYVRAGRQRDHFLTAYSGLLLGLGKGEVDRLKRLLEGVLEAGADFVELAVDDPREDVETAVVLVVRDEPRQWATRGRGAWLLLHALDRHGLTSVPLHGRIGVADSRIFGIERATAVEMLKYL